jgi:hypothetical protein
MTATAAEREQPLRLAHFSTFSSTSAGIRTVIAGSCPVAGLARDQSRTKNMLSVVHAIARQTATKNSEDFIERFSERIQALSANQDLLVRTNGMGSRSRIWFAPSSRTSPTSLVLVLPSAAPSCA